METIPEGYTSVTPWLIQQRAAELTPEEIEERAAQQEYAEAMTYVQRSLASLDLGGG